MQGDEQGGEALQYLEFASDCDPQNATYAAEVAWCKFKLSPQFGTEALKKLKEAMRLDPEKGREHGRGGVLAAHWGGS